MRTTGHGGRGSHANRLQGGTDATSADSRLRVGVFSWCGPGARRCEHRRAIGGPTCRSRIPDQVPRDADRSRYLPQVRPPRAPHYQAEQRRIVARVEELAVKIREARTLRQQAIAEAGLLSQQRPSNDLRPSVPSLRLAESARSSIQILRTANQGTFLQVLQLFLHRRSSVRRTSTHHRLGMCRSHFLWPNLGALTWVGRCRLLSKREARLRPPASGRYPARHDSYALHSEA